MYVLSAREYVASYYMQKSLGKNYDSETVVKGSVLLSQN